MTAPDLISYRHKDDQQNKTRFIQSRNEPVPSWAADVQPCTPLADALAVPEYRGTREQLINAMEEMCRREPRNQQRAIIRAALFAVLRALEAGGDHADTR